MSKFIFVVGGVMSSVGKGVATASTAKLLESRGYNVTCIKIDPYINVDAGTMSPTEHGEVFVTDDGDETDQDLGNYERFLNKSILSTNYMTTGRVYNTVINNERNLKYGGKCVEVVPHIPLEVIGRIKNAAKLTKSDIVLIEIGGTIGEYQNLLFLEAARMMKIETPKDVAFMIVSYLPIPPMVGEMKTKPTQTAVRTLNSAGIQADIILCRSEEPVDEKRKEKLSFSCNVPKNCVISAPDVSSIYDIAINFKNEFLDDRLIEILNLRKRKDNDGIIKWQALSSKIKNLKKEVKIGIVGKYFKTGDYVLADSYLSVIEAVKHASWAFDMKPSITWLSSDDYEKDPDKLKELSNFDGVIVPGGFGKNGVEGKILAIKYLREKNIPFLGLGYGMQLATIEFARNIANIKNATTEEIDYKADNLIFHSTNEIKKLNQKQMRLGAHSCIINKNTKAYKAYKSQNISERHRHKYQFNNKYLKRLEENGLTISGISSDNKFVEIVELSNHKFFVGTQFHPEFKSRPQQPHPLFLEFIASSLS
ncbi:MAG: CTP synthase [Bacilli bacterium]|nr:CTP synthase [Bacilli bacterium]